MDECKLVQTTAYVITRNGEPLMNYIGVPLVIEDKADAEHVADQLSKDVDFETAWLSRPSRVTVGPAW